MNGTQSARPLGVFLLFVLTLFLTAHPPAAVTYAQPASAPDRRAPQARPRLVLLIVVDQFRYDYLTRFGDLFGEGGLKRLMQDGAVWSNANYDHMPTNTAPGHATLMTGAWPAQTGIIGNEWFDRDAGKSVTSVSDDDTVLLGGKESGTRGASPRRLMASTVGDELRLQSNGRAKVIGISVKDRAAILPLGRHASAAYWFSTQVGHMVSSDYYFTQLPDWVQKFNASRPVDKYFGARWERLLPEGEYARRAGADAPPWEKINTAKDTNTFPHIITGGASRPGEDFYDAIDYSPFSNELLLAFAQQAIVNEGLGTDADTDVLSVSFSASDYVGHRFGPYSHEVMDITLRTDRHIAALLEFVNARVGLQNTLVAFSADHGVAPNPEHAAQMGLPGGRISVADVLKAVRQGISARYARRDSGEPMPDYVQTFSNGAIYFNASALKRDGIDRTEIERIAGEAALTVPGISRYYTRTQLASGVSDTGDGISRRVQHSFYAPRSGDVFLIYDSFKYLESGFAVATHGSPYSYDTNVPVIIMGQQVKHGIYAEAATPADIAPTLAQLLRVQSPSSATGRVLLEALVKQ
ncbi:MAG: alkaline phosphatase family protein [Pyrinomonadaceae bacterium]